MDALGANPDIPDMSLKAQARHLKHLRKDGCYPGMSLEEYIKRAGELARSAVGGDIVGYKIAEGDAVVRYNRATNDFAKGFDTGVATMFKPSGGERYYQKQFNEDGGVFDD